jgi:diacylglycerol kinase
MAPHGRAKLNPAARWQSIIYACKGIAYLLRNEPNMIVHGMATFLVVCAATIRDLNKIEWCLVLLATGIVWIAEAFNTAIEKLCDLYSSSFHPVIKIIKDVAAAAVLLAALFSVITGIIVFLL